MAILPKSARLVNQTAEVIVQCAKPIAFPPVDGKWPGCQTQQDANDCAAILAVAVSDAMTDAMSAPADYQPVSSSGGGFSVSVPLNIPGHSQVTAQVLVPAAASDFQARVETRDALFATARDTVNDVSPSLVSVALQQPTASWPAWGGGSPQTVARALIPHAYFRAGRPGANKSPSLNPLS
jgi:hypothetical protein